ncbi:hypothetical protein NKH57_28380 [Mesorhizobium sp. M1050]|uniref:hypothetical protein n=1 Tax=Mesorhizobium sp. M1050 TaxID=2957051 RepID=UPI003336150F
MDGRALERQLSEGIETIFRNGTITVVGILLAFSPGFVTHWAANSRPWRFYDLFTVVPILSGIAFQMRAVSMLLDMSSLRRHTYERANCIFMASLILTACGVGLAVLLISSRCRRRARCPALEGPVTALWRCRSWADGTSGPEAQRFFPSGRRC